MDFDNIRANFKRAFPADSILIYEFKSGGNCTFLGEKLIDVTLNNGYILRIYKLSKSPAAHVDEDDIKAKAFPFVYDSRNMSDNKQRCDFLNMKLMKFFPGHYVNIFIFNGNDWGRQSNNIKGGTYFEKGYGSEVDIVLS